MKIQELKKQALQLSSSERWQLVKTLLDSLQQEEKTPLEHKNLSTLRGIAKPKKASTEVNDKEDYISYLVEKYR